MVRHRAACCCGRLNCPIDKLPANTPCTKSSRRDSTGTALSSSSVLLTWQDGSSDETGFTVERKTGVGGSYSIVARLPANSTAFVDSGLVDSTLFFYKVYAFNGPGNSTDSNEISVTTLASLPAAPWGLTATAVSSCQINLAWTDNSTNETGFKIERSLDGSTGWAQIAQAAAQTTSYSDSNLSGGTTYNYRIRSTNAAGDSGYSGNAAATTRSVPLLPQRV